MINHRKNVDKNGFLFDNGSSFEWFIAARQIILKFKARDCKHFIIPDDEDDDNDDDENNREYHSGKPVHGHDAQDFDTQSLSSVGRSVMTTGTVERMAQERMIAAQQVRDALKSRVR